MTRKKNYVLYFRYIYKYILYTIISEDTRPVLNKISLGFLAERKNYWFKNYVNLVLNLKL